MKNTKGMDFTTGPMLKQMILFSLPIIATNLLQQFYTTADQMVVGKFAGDAALAAVGSTSYITNLLLNLFTGLTIGANVMCAKYCGAKNKERLEKTVHTAMMLALVGGIALALVGIVLARPLMLLMSTPSDIIDKSVKYMSIIFAGVPFSLLYNFGAGILRASGDSKRPLYILSVSGLINVLLNLVFVIGFNMAEAGVALATIISQMVSSAVVIMLMLKRDDDLKLVIKKLCFHKDELLSIIRIGVPAGLNAILYNIANISLQSTVNTFGKEYIAASTAGSGIGHYISMFLSSFCTAAVNFVGQNYGAKKYDRVHKAVIMAMIASFVMIASLDIIVCTIPDKLLGLFTNEQSVIDKGIGKTIILCVGYLFEVPTSVCSSALRGMERSKTPMLLNVTSICASRMIWIYVIFPLFPVFEILFLCYPVSWMLSSIAMIIAYLKTLKELKIKDCRE